MTTSLSSANKLTNTLPPTGLLLRTVHMIAMQRPHRYLFLLLLLLLLWATAPAGAQSPPPPQNGITLTATAGYDGLYKNDNWVPVNIQVANNGPSLEGELRIAIVTNSRDELRYTAPVTLPTQSDKQLILYVHVPNLTGRLTVELLDDNGRLVATAETNPLDAVDSNGLLYAVVSSELAELGFLENVPAGHTDAGVGFLNIDQLPDVPAALNAINVLIFTNVDTGRLTAGQRAAVEAWVTAGGVLVVTGGLSGPQTTAALSDLLPVSLTGSTTIADLPALSAEFGTQFRDPGPYVVTTSTLRTGELLLLQDDLPLLASQPLGQGTVYFLALDPNLAPLLDWDGNERLWAQIAGAVPTLPDWANGAKNSYSATNAVTRLPFLALPSAILLFCFLTIYVIVVGPLNYLVLKRRKRRELAWFTIPATVLFFSLLAYVSSLFLSRNSTLVNEMSMVYGEAGSDTGRVNSLLGLYSPRRAVYTMQLPGDALTRPFENNYDVLSGPGNLDAVVRSSDVVLQNVRVDVSGVETFVADSYRPLPNITGRVNLLNLGSTPSLDISLQNNSSITLTDAGLLIGSSYVRLGELAPGALVQRTEPLPGLSSSYSSYSPSPGSALGSLYADIFDNVDYYNDPEIYPRYQLLESLSDYYGYAVSGSIPAGVVTLLAWSDQPQLEISLRNEDAPDRTATTAYFIEIPFNQSTSSGQSLQLPVELLNWSITDQAGVYDTNIANFYLPSSGYIEYTFTPWPEFQALTPASLDVVLQYTAESGTPDSSLALRLWDWDQGDWITLETAASGTRPVPDHEQFIGPGNEVRLRLQNSGIYGFNIEQVYPLLSGTMR